MNQFLLDTNVLLWYFGGSKRIRPVKKLIASENAEVFISVASWWEMVIKVRAGKIKVDIHELRSFAREHGFSELGINGDCMEAYLELPDLHKDPFDHILLAQAMSCPMRLITGDALLADYSSLVMVI
jgi:PIN domain nuclease of toxin-antitoxin system